MTDLAKTLEHIQELRPRHQAWLKARAAMEQRIWAYCARYVGRDDANAVKAALLAGKSHDLMTPPLEVGAMPLVDCVHTLAEQEKALAKTLAGLASELPVADWWRSYNGLDLPGLGKLISQTGDLRNYPTVAKLWTYMGLAVINGERQRKKTGDAALVHKYSPQRRSFMWQIGDAVKRQKSGYYPDLYRSLKEKYRAQWEAEGKRVIPAAQVRKSMEPGTYVTLGHLDNHAKRLMEKEILKDLWRRWRDVVGTPFPKEDEAA